MRSCTGSYIFLRMLNSPRSGVLGPIAIQVISHLCFLFIRSEYGWMLSHMRLHLRFVVHGVCAVVLRPALAVHPICLNWSLLQDRAGQCLPLCPPASSSAACHQWRPSCTELGRNAWASLRLIMLSRNQESSSVLVHLSWILKSNYTGWDWEL